MTSPCKPFKPNPRKLHEFSSGGNVDAASAGRQVLAKQDTESLAALKMLEASSTFWLRLCCAKFIGVHLWFKKKTLRGLCYYPHKQKLETCPIMWWPLWFRKKGEEQPVEGDMESLAGRLSMSSTELAVVIGPQDEACVCGDWVGSILSVEGKHPEYPSMAQAVADGLFHPQCRHHVAAYDAASLTEDRIEHAEARTRHAVNAMAARRQRSDEVLEPAAPFATAMSGKIAKFEQTYRDAHQADVSGDLALAREKCEAALALIDNGEDLYGDAQRGIALILRARLNKLPGQTCHKAEGG